MKHDTPDQADRMTTTQRVRQRLHELDHLWTHRARLRFRALLAGGMESSEAAVQAVRETRP